MLLDHLMNKSSFWSADILVPLYLVLIVLALISGNFYYQEWANAPELIHYYHLDSQSLLRYKERCLNLCLASWGI